ETFQIIEGKREVPGKFVYQENSLIGIIYFLNILIFDCTIHQSQETYLLSLCLQLARHLKSNQPSQRVATQAIWSFCLHITYHSDIIACHICDAGTWFFVCFDPFRL